MLKLLDTMQTEVEAALNEAIATPWSTSSRHYKCQSADSDVNVSH
jgi:hypothetical protein